MSIVVAKPRSLHEAMIKCRFADTILKAKINLNDSPLERERLTKRHLQENTRLQAWLQAKFKAAEAAKLKEDRQAARNALIGMELSVVTDAQQNLEIETQLYRLCGCRDPLKRVISGYPLRCLGLSLKPEFLGGDDDEDDIEDGEICD